MRPLKTISTPLLNSEVGGVLFGTMMVAKTASYRYRASLNMIEDSSIKVGMRTLIIAPTSGIKEQWGETLIKMFKVPPEKVKVVKSPKDFKLIGNIIFCICSILEER